MGYEIQYSYYNRKEDGVGYNTDEPKTMTKQLGKMEDIPLDKLANAVMSQMARRDIFVTSVEIYEFTKRKITFKETKGGILIKNKKFMLDGTVVEAEEEVSEPAQAPAQEIKHTDRPIRWEIFDPDPGAWNMLQRKGWKITPKKKYPILREQTVVQRINVNGMMTEIPTYEYIITDDDGNKFKISSMHFVPEQRGLIGMDQAQAEYARASMPRLTHMDNHGSPDMPVIRRG